MNTVERIEPTSLPAGRIALSIQGKNNGLAYDVVVILDADTDEILGVTHRRGGRVADDLVCSAVVTARAYRIFPADLREMAA